MASKYRRHRLVIVMETRWLLYTMLPKVCLTDKATAVSVGLLCNAHSPGNLEYVIQEYPNNRWVIQEWRCNRKGRYLNGYVNIAATQSGFNTLAGLMERSVIRRMTNTTKEVR